MSASKKQHKTYYRYYNDTYGSVMYFYIGSAEGAYAWLKKKFNLSGSNPVESRFAGLSFVLSGDDNFVSHVIWMPKMDFTCEEYATLSHECLHTAIRIMQDRGCESMGVGSSEELAYFHSAIYEAFLKQVYKDRYKTKEVSE